MRASVPSSAISSIARATETWPPSQAGRKCIEGRRDDRFADLDRDLLVRSQDDLTQISRVWPAVDERVHWPLKSGHVGLAEAAAPDIEELPQRVTPRVGRFDVNDAGGVMGVQPVERRAARKPVHDAERLDDTDAERHGDLFSVVEERQVRMDVDSEHLLREPLDTIHRLSVPAGGRIAGWKERLADLGRLHKGDGAPLRGGWRDRHEDGRDDRGNDTANGTVRHTNSISGLPAWAIGHRIRPEAPTGVIDDISDTARWVAVYRARETEREDAVFRDRFARRLAGERGEEIARAHTFGEANEWPFIARTFMFDTAIAREIERGVDTVICLAAGLDARPYRMDLPSSLRWIEVDLPGLIAYKETVLAHESPRCALERITQDLADEEARRTLFDRLAQNARRAVVIAEGLLVYLTADQVSSLARDLAAEPSFERWIIDIANPALITLMQREMSEHVNRAGIPFRFGPADGPSFFESCGWKPADVRSAFRTAADLKRLPPELQAYAQYPDPPEPWKQPYPWSGVCVLGRTSQAHS